MKKVVAIVAVMVLMMGLSAYAQDVASCKGKLNAIGYGAYAIGFGDVFDDTKMTVGNVTTEHSFDAGLGFGVIGQYGVLDKLFVGLEVGLQMYKAEAKTTGAQIPVPDVDETNTEVNILANGMYAISYTDDLNAFFITAGLGMYGGDNSEFGLNGGFMFRRMLSPNVGVMVMPRFHYVMSDPAGTMAQIAAGVVIPIPLNK